MILLLPIGAVALAPESQGALDWLTHAQQFGIAVPFWLSGLRQSAQSCPTGGGRVWRSHKVRTRFWGRSALDLCWTDSIAWSGDPQGFRIVLGDVGRPRDATEPGYLDVAAHTIGARTLFGAFGEEFIVRMASAVRATVNGTVLVSLLEGGIVGIGYAVAGVPQPLMFATFTVILAFIPFGAWLPSVSPA